MQRFFLRLQKCNFLFEYAPGKTMVAADALSRAHLLNCKPEIDTSDMTHHVHSIISQLPVSEARLTQFKGQLQRFYKLDSHERAVKIPTNDICITEIGQALLEIFEFKVKFPRKIPKIRNFANVSIIRVEQ